MDAGLIGLGAGLGAGLAIVGGGLGIGKLAASAVEAIARQPEAAGDIKGAMIITAAFIEGATLFAVLVCLLIGLNADPTAAITAAAEAAAEAAAGG
jgi:F-type H+-transporting ATPase subunit c